MYSPKAGRPCLWQGKKIMRILGTHQSHGHEWRLGWEKGAGKNWEIQLPSRLYKPSQPPGKERLESISNQLHNRSTRLLTHEPVSYEIGVARGKEPKHARSHREIMLFIGKPIGRSWLISSAREAIRNRTVQKTLSMSDIILKFFFIALNSKSDCTLQILPTLWVGNRQQEHGMIQSTPPTAKVMTGSQKSRKRKRNS